MTSGVTATSSSVTGLYVGTSGWSYPSWKPGFYPPEAKTGEFLRFYAERLSSVELNTTGYRLPAEQQFERWAAATPPGFRFAPKLNAYRLSAIGTFEERVRRLGDRLGPVRMVVGSTRDEGFLQLALGSVDPSLQIAFDFRHDSWEALETALPENAVRVNVLEAAAPFRYLRLREPPYDDAALAEWADRIRTLLADGIEVYCYFRHEDEPSAPRYAERLRELVSPSSIVRSAPSFAPPAGGHPARTKPPREERSDSG
jgi:uncharacterized protein YecE (DUF72 family)